MITKPISTRMPPVVIEYDCYGKRKTKEFTDPYEAKWFWVKKFNGGKNPKVKKAEQ